MRVFLWLALLIVISPPTFADDIDLDKLARPERERLARCMSDTMQVIEKHHVSSNLFVIWDLFDATCGVEIERVKLAAAKQSIGNMLVGSRQAVVVLYGDDLRKVQPERKSCRPKMCGASPCVSLDEPSEYECVINQ